jgi:hypothetical protein
MSVEPIEVTARFDAKGEITPLHFTWKDGVYRVESTGRRWLDDKGQHILVMVSSGQIYELTFQGGDGRWYIGRTRPDCMAI